MATHRLPDCLICSGFDHLQTRLVNKHNKQTLEGVHLRVVREFVVRAAPSWNDVMEQLTWWFIKEHEPENSAHSSLAGEAPLSK